MDTVALNFMRKRMKVLFTSLPMSKITESVFVETTIVLHSKEMLYYCGVMKAIPGDTWFSGRGWGLRWDWGFPNLPNSLQIIIKRGLRLLFFLSRYNTILSHLWLWRQDQPSTYWNEKATHNSLTFFSTVCLERLLSTMDAISCLSAFTDLCFLPETSFDRQGAVWVQWSSRQNRQRRRRKLQR